MRIIRVALDVPVTSLFDYRAEHVAVQDIGLRVVVPFGNKVTVGVIVALTDASEVPPARLKSALRILRDVPALSRTDLQLLEFCSDYYHYPLGQVIMNALPAALRRLRSAAHREDDCFFLTGVGLDADWSTLPRRAVVKHRVLAALRGRGYLDQAAARALSARAPAALRELAARGWVERRPCPAPREGVAAPPAAASPPLTAAQAAAVDSIRASLGGYTAWLLHGVTGSGKTEVYLRLTATALDSGRQVLLLVPEIALTPQLEATVRSRLPAALVVSLHSALNERERARHWRLAQSGKARVVLGTRLAVYTPLPDLGLIIVDEEHDSSFKQTEGMRYSARDLAVFRARLRGVSVVLGSATPSLESYSNALSGRYRLVMLTERIGVPPPRVACVDTRGERLANGLSARLLAAIEERLAQGHQSLVFINRRGYAPVLMCHACGWTSGCHRCAAHLVLHLEIGRLRCHHCGHEEPVPPACPECGNPALAPLGQGTQRVEAALKQRFPPARILRIDSDSTRRKLAWNAMRRQIHGHEVDILVGTQIMAKGHDFPLLNLVGVLNADSALYSTDFRAAERLYAQLMQVAGRAGRSDVRGQVLVQTEFPDHPLYRALCENDYAAFARAQLAERRQAGLPPFVHQALLRAEAPRLATALEFLADAAALARGLRQAVTIYDPVEASMRRLAGRERAQLLVQAGSRRRLQAFLQAWHDKLAAQAPRKVRWTLDVDPLEF